MNIRHFHRISLCSMRKFAASSQSESRHGTKALFLHNGNQVSTKTNTRAFETLHTISLYPPDIRSLSSTSDKKSYEENEKTSLHKHSQTTIDSEEVNKFTRLSALWWNEGGDFKPLHSLNELRIPLIRDALVSSKKLDQYDVTKPLDGFWILDVGSGGGILSEPLARLGASVVGLEASEESIKIAESHLAYDPAIRDKVQYVRMTVEELAEREVGKFDAVVASEVLEHVSNASMFVTCACKLLRPGGSIFFTTLNKTRLAYILAIVAAENILHVVSPGTHDWEKFISPRDLQYMLDKNNLSTRLIHGMCYNPLTNHWTWIKDTSINYALHAVKPLVADRQE